MSREIYNFMWVTPSADTGTSHPVALQEQNTINRPELTARAVILFPSLLTPLIHVDSEGEKYFELLIAADSDLATLPDLINRQLRITVGLDASKPYDARPLFGGGAGGHIVVKKIGPINAKGTDILKTESKFSGILHPSAAKALMDAGLTDAYAVRIDKSCLPVSSPGGAARCSRIEPKFVGYTRDAHGKVNRFARKAVVGGELHDALIRKMLDARIGKDDVASGGKADAIPGRCRYAFPSSGTSFDLSQVDPGQPVQSYHPLFVFADKSFTHASIGHFSDLHVNSRWELLSKSPARVIEYGDGQHESESPSIGGLVAETTRSVHDTMHRAFTSADLVLIGGDLIDHIRNAYAPKRVTSKRHEVLDVWDALDLDQGYSDLTYPYGIDLVAFYSLVVDAMRSHKKPAFAISGNHDCYVEAFGISPRVNSNRANAGIPADLNLTFYEALLAFGPTSGMLRKLGSSFDKDWFEWFYLVFTPFNDWWETLPKQSVVGLGWGGSEDILTPGPLSAQGIGHLPRSKDGVSDAQLALLKQAVSQHAEHKVTLTTHFTFLSFDEGVPNGSIGLLDPKDHKNNFEWGTFEKNRGDVIKMLHNNEIACVLTGHSHRRGLYLLNADHSGHAQLFDAGGEGVSVPDEAARTGAAASPAIVVSDSAGPYPRNNQHGEFERWGSDRPGGTLVTFDPSSGAVARVTSLQATQRPLPRAAVALDYADVVLDTGLFEEGTLRVLYVSAEQNNGAWDREGKDVVWRIRAPLTWQAKRWKIWPTRLVFAYQDVTTRKWVRVETVSGEGDEFVVPAQATNDLRTWLRGGQSGFVSMQFATSDPALGAGYDWSHHWNFEAVTETVRWRIPGDRVESIGYAIRRPSRKIKGMVVDRSFREIPNFEWRRAQLGKYQVRSV